MKKWSPTMIRATKGCKRLFEKKYVEQAPVEVSIPEFIEGHRIHEACEQFLKTGNEKYLLNLPLQTQVALKLIKSWKGNLYIEKEFENDFVYGVADVVFENENQWIVIDIKTRFDSDISDDDYVQLYTYLYFLQQEKQKEGFIGILAVHNQFNTLNVKKSKLQTVEELEQYIKHQIELAEKRLKHMNINTSYCKYCEYIISCDAVAEKPTSIEEIARKYLQLKVLVNQYETMLKEHVNITGKNIQVDGMEIGMHVRNTTTVDLQTLFEISQMLNISITEMLKPDITVIKKLSKKYPELANAINIEQDYYFTTKRIKNEDDS